MFLERFLNEPAPPYFKHLSLLPPPNPPPLPHKNFDSSQSLTIMTFLQGNARKIKSKQLSRVDCIYIGKRLLSFWTVVDLRFWLLQSHLIYHFTFIYDYLFCVALRSHKTTKFPFHPVLKSGLLAS